MPNTNEALVGFVPAWAQERLNICRQCENYFATYCKLTTEKASILYSNHTNKCPDNKWDVIVFE